MMKLALRLGKTLSELNASLTAEEYYLWLAFDSLNPIGDERQDLHAAQVSSAVYQSQGGKVSIKDCLLNFDYKNNQEEAQEMDIGDAFANLFKKHKIVS